MSPLPSFLALYLLCLPTCYVCKVPPSGPCMSQQYNYYLPNLEDIALLSSSPIRKISTEFQRERKEAASSSYTKQPQLLQSSPGAPTVLLGREELALFLESPAWLCLSVGSAILHLLEKQQRVPHRFYCPRSRQCLPAHCASP